jgi:membrane-associated phospholipid phosphatase
MKGEPSRRFARQIRFLQARLSPEGYLGLHLTVGLLVILITGWWFADIAEDMSREAATRLLDNSTTAWFQAHATPLLTRTARVVTFFGSVGFVTGASLFLAGILAFRRSFYRLLGLALTMGGGSLLNILLKHFFHRQRPVLENPLVTLSSYGFPSGHTMGSTLFYGGIAILLTYSVRTWRLRVLTCCIAAVIVVLVGISRIYLGAHYLTDVLGAIAVGLAWLAFCWTGVETLRRWRGRPR